MLFLGLDSSTQGIKAVVCDDSLRVVSHSSVQYAELPGYGPDGEICTKSASGEVTQPACMFFDALDVVLRRLREAGTCLSEISAIAGSGQQHGSVYWKKGADKTLNSLDAVHAAHPLKALLADCFSYADCPIWMDSSTTAECAAVEAAVGGAEALAQLTGSRAYERFTLQQILKRAKGDPEAWAATEAVSLISSALASVLAGRIVPIDAADGSGMNLLDLRLDPRGKEPEPAGLAYGWSARLLEAFRDSAPLLADKLAPPVPPHTCFGRISPYFCARFGFAESCSVIAWSGDNPCSLAGLGLQAEGDVAVSLGTSDTLFAVVPRAAARPGLDGHLFANPVDPLPPLGRGSLMALLCFKNGSLTRERVRNAAACGSWDAFNAALTAFDSDSESGVDSMDVGIGRRVGFYLDLPEITPSTSRGGDFRFVRASAVFAVAGSPAAFESASGAGLGPVSAKLGDGTMVTTADGGHWIAVPSFADPSARHHSAAAAEAAAAEAAAAAVGSESGVPTWSAADARAVVEGRFLAMRLHAQRLGLSSGGVRRVIATGGASANKTMLQVLANVFGAPVFTAESANSAALGAAFRAAHGWACAHIPARAAEEAGAGAPASAAAAPARGGASGFVAFESVLRYGVRPALFEAAGAPVPEALRLAAVAGSAAAATADAAGSECGPGASATSLVLAASPDLAAHEAYSKLLPAYAACEARVVELTRAV